MAKEAIGCRFCFYKFLHFYGHHSFESSLKNHARCIEGPSVQVGIAASVAARRNGNPVSRGAQ